MIPPGWHLAARLVEGADTIKSEEQAVTLAERISELTPMRRAGNPAELRGLALYLASDASSFVTGAVFMHDSGWSSW